jgi:hypothetical protein
MSNELVKQAMPLNEIMKMAEVFAQSGMFTDAKQMGQAFVKIQAGQEVGIPPFASMSGIHIIQGKPTIGAGIIASCIKGSGKYDYKVAEMSEKVCSINFFQGTENIGNSTFTIEDAKKAGTKNIDKFPKNMLFARAISNGVKWYCPDVFAGPVYVPEEMEHLTVDVKHEVIEPTVTTLPAITQVQLTKLCKKISDEGMSNAECLELAKKHFTLSEQDIQIIDACVYINNKLENNAE